MSPAKLRLLSGILRLLAWAKIHVLESLTSVYFDTADARLLEAGVFLRVRSIGDRHIQTIKAIIPGQLFSREEWEQEIKGPLPDLALAKNTALSSLSGRHLGRLLKPVFESRVERTVRELKKNGSEIEVALDQGVIDTGVVKTAVSELELEIKSGDPADRQLAQPHSGCGIDRIKHGGRQ